MWQIWDYAAGTLLVREANGDVYNYKGEKLLMELNGNIVAGNQNIVKILVENIFKCGKEKVGFENKMLLLEGKNETKNG